MTHHDDGRSEAGATLRELLGHSSPDLPGPIGVIALWHPGDLSPTAAEGAVHDALATLGLTHHQPTVEVMGIDDTRVFVVVIPSSPRSALLRAKLIDAGDDTGVLTIHHVSPDEETADASLRLIREAFNMATTARWEFGHAMRLYDLLSQHVLSGPSLEAASWTVRAGLGPVLLNRSRTMIETTEVVMGPCRWTATGAAKRLGISVGAFRKRLHRLGGLIGVDFFDPSGVTEVPPLVRQAFHLYELHKPFLRPAGDPWWRDPSDL